MSKGFDFLIATIKGLFGTAFYLVMWSLIIGLPFMWLWNWLMPMIFQLPHIGFLQGWGLLFLAGLLFGRK